MTFGRSFLKGFLFAAFVALFLHEAIAFCSALSPPSEKFDGFCSITITGVCRDTGCNNESKETTLKCIKVTDQDKSVSCECKSPD